MPLPLYEQIRRKVIEQWFNGLPRDKIAEDNNIGAGTVSSVISNYKVGLETLDFDSIRQLALEIRKQQLNWSELASHYRLYNYLLKSGAAEEDVESFIANVSSIGGIPPENIIQRVNQIHQIAKEESIPLDQVPDFVKQKIEEKKRIEEELREADTLLQNKNVRLEAIDEHIKLNEELNKHGLSTHDIPRLLNLLKNAKSYGFDGKEIADKLYNMLELEWKERELKDKCKKLSKRISKFKDVVPLTEDIAAWGIGIDELLALKVGINQAAKHYNLPPLAAILQLIDDLKNITRLMDLGKGYLHYICKNIRLTKPAHAKPNLLLL
ncbi:MAG: hypothetical protein ACJ71P_07545 [Nitrososphaeraceae archaeon]